MTEYIKETVRTLRQKATPTEQKFWQIVRNRKIDGLRFYRQHPIEFEIDGHTRFLLLISNANKKNLLLNSMVVFINSSLSMTAIERLLLKNLV
ncbi:DUF559 domain-containing protein [Candidatus Latescibacterota bacterium]